MRYSIFSIALIVIVFLPIHALSNEGDGKGETTPLDIESQSALTQLLGSVLIGQLRDVEQDLHNNIRLRKSWERVNAHIKQEKLELEEIIPPSLDEIKEDLENINQTIKKLQFYQVEDNTDIEDKQKLRRKLDSSYEDLMERFRLKRISRSLRSREGFNEEYSALSGQLDDFFLSHDEKLVEILEFEGVPFSSLLCRISFRRIMEITEIKEITGGYYEQARECIDDINKFLSKNLDKNPWEQYKLTALNILSSLEVEADSRLKVLLGRIAEANTRVTQLKHEIAESRKQIQARETVELERIKSDISENEIILISVTLIGFSLIIISVLIAMSAMVKTRIAQNSRSDSFSYPLFLELVTVFVLAVVLIILGLANKINNEALAALIGGMSGYVLGRLKDKPSAPEGYPLPPREKPPTSQGNPDEVEDPLKQRSKLAEQENQ